MSIYFQTTPAGVSEKTTPAKGVGASHQVEPLFAFASTPGGKILICNEEGDTVHEIATSSAAPTSLAFHPSRAIFAVGYRNGSFLVSGCGIENPLTNSTLSHLDQREQPQLHQGSQITAVGFGTSLVDETEAPSSSSSPPPSSTSTSLAGGGANSRGASQGGLSVAVAAAAAGTHQSHALSQQQQASSASASGYDVVYFTTQDKVVSAWSISTDSGAQVCSALWHSKLASPVNIITRGNGFLFLHHNTSPNILLLDESAQTVSVGTTLDPKEVVGNPMRSIWDGKNRSLVVLTTTAHLISYKVGFDGKMNQTSFRKLNTSTITDTNVLQLAYVSQGVVAVAAGDATIRIIAWNSNNNTSSASSSSSSSSTSTSLYFPDAAFGGATVAQQQVVVALGSSSHRGRLCAGNRAGQVAVWQFVGSQDSLDEFQLLAHVGAPSAATATLAKPLGGKLQQQQQPQQQQIDNFAVDRVLMSNTANGSVLILGVEYVQLLQGTVRQRKWHGRAMALQTSPSEVVVQNTSGNTFHVFPVLSTDTTAATSSTVTSPTQPKKVVPHVRGVDIFWPNVLLWTGKSADVFSLVESSGTVTPVASFEQPLPAVALYADGVLLSRADRVQMTTFSKHANYTLTVAEAEGTPQVIHVADEVGAMVTNKGSLRVFRIGARDLKAVGPARQLRVPNGNVVAHIGMMAINRTGKKVAFTTAATIASPSAAGSGDEGGKLAGNSPVSLAASVFVHDVDTDSVFEFCFGEDRVPSFFSWNVAFVNYGASVPSAAIGGASSSSSSSPTATGTSSGPDAESNLLAVETRIVRFSSSSSSTTTSKSNNNVKNNNNNNNTIDDEESNKKTSPLAALNASVQYLPSSFQYHHGGNQQIGGGGNTHDASANASMNGGGAPDRHVTTLFSSPRGVFHHHTFPLHPQQSGLIGCSVPHLVLGLQLEADDDEDEEFTTEQHNRSSLTGGGITKKYEHSLFLKPLRDFDGMQQADSDVKLRAALMHFAYFAAIGNMDEAYKAVKLVKDPAIWVNMAKMCVSTKRIDVAEVCLSNMQDTVAARAVRETRDEEVLDVRIAVLAMALGLVDDAERLLRRCKRFDLLTELYIACGRWDDAVANCEQHDRLRTTSVFFRHAHQAEDAGQYDVALQLYGRAKCLGTESPRLFFATNRVEELQAKIAETDDRDLLMWWAQYLESGNDVEGALACYKRARDGFNVIRLLVSQGQIDAAEDFLREASLTGTSSTSTTSSSSISAASASSTAATRTTTATAAAASKTSSKSGLIDLGPSSSSSAPGSSGVSAAGAAFFIARHYESKSNWTKAVQMYEQAAAFENAIRIAKDQEMLVDVLRISLKCGNNHTALESGRYFEERNMYDRAVQLYRHGGDNQKAIDVCIKGGLFDDLHRISESLEQGADPETFIAMASHFEKSGHYNKAVEMLVFGKAFNEALQLCLDQNVKLTDAMAEAMTLPKSDNAEDEEYRLNLLRKIAKVAKDQDSYHLACKKYTQAGDVMKGVKALLKSGDTDKIIFFANHIRNNEVYYATANFLQSTDWAHNQNIFKSIVTFYTRAKQFESLALFYDTAAQHQIDENRSYEKAAGLLREGLKALEKGGDLINPVKRENLGRRVAAVDAFVRATTIYKGAPGGVEALTPQTQSELVGICEDLLSRSRAPHPDAELVRSAIRLGDVGALLAEYYANSQQQNKFQKAYEILEQMNSEGVQLNLFIEAGLMKKIVEGAGPDVAPFTQIPQQQFRRKSSVKVKLQEDDVADDVEEEI